MSKFLEATDLLLLTSLNDSQFTAEIRDICFNVEF